MHIHILGICGTFMGSLAVLARQLGHQVSGCDANVYPPMSTQLQEHGIDLMEGYLPEHLSVQPDLVVIGNALSRGNPLVEAVLNSGLPYTSGPQWLSEQVLKDKWVLAVAGTHGKTTTSSMLAWILEYAGMKPGYLIGGIPKNFSVSAAMGESDFFVIEADEYDSAFFDKRSKFVHYRPRTAILNNLEFDHADIFADLKAIQIQFHHLVRTIPGLGCIIVPAREPVMEQVLAMGCWTPLETFCASSDDLLFEPQQTADAQCQWQVRPLADDCHEFEVHLKKPQQAPDNTGTVCWPHTGQHNMCNAVAAIAAARHVGVSPEISIAALCGFEGVKRRMELLAQVNGVTVYDDFAHHPTAIETTLEGLRAKVRKQRILAIIEPRSNTMRMGSHKGQLATAVACADQVFWYQPEGLDWDLQSVIEASKVPSVLFRSTEAIIDQVLEQVGKDDHIVIMSNGGFEGIHHRLIKALDFAEDNE